VILGSHQSVAGGPCTGIERAVVDGCQTLQIFTKNGSQWAGKPLLPEECARFRAAARRAGLELLAHDSYLINLAAPDDAMWERSIEAFADELRRCSLLGIPRLVMHPGSPLDAGEGFGLKRIAAGLDRAFALAGVRGVRVLLESTAGQGNHLGWRFEHLRDILHLARSRRRLGVCLDTCHLLAAGYDFTTPAGYERVFDEFDRVVGLRRLEAFHLNDSKKPLGSRVDRHEIVGRGHVGLETFRRLVNDPRFTDVPAALETPPLEDGSPSFAHCLGILRSLLRRA
jgi:deoxyribonuclease-4